MMTPAPVAALRTPRYSDASSRAAWLSGGSVAALAAALPPGLGAGEGVLRQAPGRVWPRPPSLPPALPPPAPLQSHLSGYSSACGPSSCPAGGSSTAMRRAPSRPRRRRARACRAAARVAPTRPLPCRAPLASRPARGRGGARRAGRGSVGGPGPSAGGWPAPAAARAGGGRRAPRPPRGRRRRGAPGRGAGAAGGNDSSARAIGPPGAGRGGRGRPLCRGSATRAPPDRGPPGPATPPITVPGTHHGRHSRCRPDRGQRPLLSALWGCRKLPPGVVGRP
jgi:hypothetical protein